MIDETACEVMNVDPEVYISKMMFFTASPDPSRCIYINGHTLEQVLHLKYPGFTIQRKDQDREDVSFRADCTGRVFLRFPKTL